MASKRSSEIKVGIFAVVVAGVFLASIVVLTSKTSLFRETIMLHTSFRDIAGLINGSEVRLSGVTVGFVEAIEFSPQEGDPTVQVAFTIDDRGINRVMKDGTASIGSLGLLGKKYLEISPGTKAAGAAVDGDFLEGIEPASMAEALDKAGIVLDNIKDTAASLKVLFGSMAGEEGVETDLSRTISSVRRIIHEVETGNGTLHELIYSAQKAQILADLQKTTAHIRAIVARVEQGPGNLHEVVYGEQVGDLLSNLKDTSAALREVIADIKDENGVIHGLIYDESRTELLTELQKTAANMALITERIERGEGTLGGLLIDPTIYEDLKKLTGEVERNRVLKTYIRYVVRKREQDLEDRSQPPPNPPPDQGEGTDQQDNDF